MIIKTIKVENFRCLLEAEMPCNNLTILVGANGTGKSCMLKALEFFFETDITYNEQDFYNHNTNDPIRISVTFHQLTPNEIELFNPYLDGTSLTIVKELTYPSSRNSQKYYGSRLYNPDFDAFRNSSGQGFRREYQTLTANEKYQGFSPYTNREDAENTLIHWEQEHSDECEQRRDDGQFFGFRNVGRARLERFTRFIPIPAVYDAETEATEGRGTVITQLMDILVRSSLRDNPDYQALIGTVQAQYNTIFEPERIDELQRLEGELSQSLRRFVVDSDVKLSWVPGAGIRIDPPQALIDLVEDGYRTSIGRTGHGLQRAFIISLFQHLAVIQSTLRDEETPEDQALSCLIIAIEEPELYQHPDRQRHFTKTLIDLTRTGIPSVLSGIQGFYCTHSPLMIDPLRFDDLRIFRKIDHEEGLPKVTSITFTSLSEVASLLEQVCQAQEGSYTSETLLPRLQAIMTPMMNESYFAKLVVLVEGIKDRAIVLGTAAFLGYDFERVGIAVIPCNGKTSIDRPLAILKKLNIPYYVIWDSDEDKAEPTATTNHELLRLVEGNIVDYPYLIDEDYTCFRTDFESYLREAIGKDFIPLLQAYVEENRLGQIDPALNLPLTILALLTRASESRIDVSEITQIVERIYAKYEALD